jgi:hypothetical protein
VKHFHGMTPLPLLLPPLPLLLQLQLQFPPLLLFPPPLLLRPPSLLLFMVVGMLQLPVLVVVVPLLPPLLLLPLLVVAHLTRGQSHSIGLVPGSGLGFVCALGAKRQWGRVGWVHAIVHLQGGGGKWAKEEDGYGYDRIKRCFAEFQTPLKSRTSTNNE